MKSLDEQLSETLHRAAHGWRIALDRRLRPLGYSRSRWMALLHVSRNDAITHGELAELLGIEAPTLVRLIDRMEADGLLQRRASASDRRVKHLHLSPAGKREMDHIWAIGAQLRKEILNGLSKTEISTTLNVLQQIRNKLENIA